MIKDIEIHRLEVGQEDRKRLVETLCESFNDDPVMNYFIRQDANRFKGFEQWFNYMVYAYHPNPIIYASEGYEGAAIWFAGKDCHPAGFMEIFRSLPTFLQVSGLNRIPKLASVGLAGEKVHPLDKPHYYLIAVGVRPQFQGQGIGTRLLQPMLARCDKEGCGAYLESSNERNIPLYQRLGFTNNGTILGPKAPNWWSMWRDCQASNTGTDF